MTWLETKLGVEELVDDTWAGGTTELYEISLDGPVLLHKK